MHPGTEPNRLSCPLEKGKAAEHLEVERLLNGPRLLRSPTTALPQRWRGDVLHIVSPPEERFGSREFGGTTEITNQGETPGNPKRIQQGREWAGRQAGRQPETKEMEPSLGGSLSACTGGQKKRKSTGRLSAPAGLGGVLCALWLACLLLQLNQVQFISRIRAESVQLLLVGLQDQLCQTSERLKEMSVVVVVVF